MNLKAEEKMKKNGRVRTKSRTTKGKNQPMVSTYGEWTCHLIKSFSLTISNDPLWTLVSFASRNSSIFTGFIILRNAVSSLKEKENISQIN